VEASVSEPVEFGTKAAADRAREEYDEYVCPVDDDRRLKTVAFVSDTPDELLSSVRATAEASRLDEADGTGLIELGESERERIKAVDGFDQGVANVGNWRRARALYAREGHPEWFAEDIPALADYDDPSEGAGEQLERRQRGASGIEGGRTGRGGSARNEGERDARDRRRQAEAARAQERGECDHARGHCEHGDPDACEFLQDVCGYSESEVDALLPDTSADGGLESGDPDEDELTGEQAGVVHRAMGGYIGGVEEAERALETLREAWANAQQAADAVNGVRRSVGYEPQHFHRLEAFQADLMDFYRTVAADCVECHADHADHDHAVTDGEREDVREAAVDGASETPVGTAAGTDAATIDAEAWVPTAEGYAFEGREDGDARIEVRDAANDYGGDAYVAVLVDGEKIHDTDGLPRAEAEQQARELAELYDPADLRDGGLGTPGEPAIETDDQRTLDGDRADDQARFAGEERGGVDAELEATTEPNPGGLEADEREPTDDPDETEQTRPDAFRVPEGGQRSL
jgi:hypothetical protein